MNSGVAGPRFKHGAPLLPTHSPPPCSFRQPNYCSHPSFLGPVSHDNRPDSATVPAALDPRPLRSAGTSTKYTHGPQVPPPVVPSQSPSLPKSRPPPQNPLSRSPKTPRATTLTDPAVPREHFHNTGPYGDGFSSLETDQHRTFTCPTLPVCPCLAVI